MNTLTLSAEVRKVEGRKVKKLRKQGILPANIFGKKIKSASISLKFSEFDKVFKSAGETTVVTLKIGKDKKPVLIYNVQVDPVSDKPIHVDFLQVDLKEKITASIPVELVGESPAEKQGIGTVVLYINEIEVEALPADLLEKFVVDVSNLSEVDQALYVKDLVYEKTKVEVKTDLKSILVKVEPPQKITEAPPPSEEVVSPVAKAPASGEEGVTEKKDESLKDRREEKPQG